jgi:integrase
MLRIVIHTDGAGMAHIRKRLLADGTVKFTAEIVIKKYGIIVHTESKTFGKQKLARDWALRREVELQEQTVYGKKDYLPLGDVIGMYLREFEPEGKTKRYDIEKLRTREIAKIDVNRLDARDLIKHIRLRNTECKPQTAANDLIWLGQVVKTMKNVIRIDTDLTIFDQARDVLRREKLVAKSVSRDRMPSYGEILRLARFFRGQGGNVPMYDIFIFALASSRRLSEITRLEWDDLNFDKQTGMVRDLKHPSLKKGNNKRFKFERKAWQVVLRQPRGSRYIFPHNPKTIGTYFERGCKFLGIEGLHFHDARHYASSRLFRKGYSIEQVQQFTLHTDWKMLARYTHLKPEDIL